MTDGKVQTQRVAAALTTHEIGQIDEWGFARKIRNRSDAMRALIQIGLKSEPKPTK